MPASGVSTSSWVSGTGVPHRGFNKKVIPDSPLRGAPE